MASDNDTPTPTAAPFLYYDRSKAQASFGWLTPQQAQIRSAQKRARMREKKAAKRDYARPQESGSQRRRQIKEKP